MYFADHPGSNSLVIENNFLINCENGIGLTTPSNISYHNKNIDIRFNSIYNSKVNSILTKKRFQDAIKVTLSDTNIQIHGTDDKTLLLKPIKNPDFVIENGTHFMMYKRSEKVSEIISKFV